MFDGVFKGLINFANRIKEDVSEILKLVVDIILTMIDDMNKIAVDKIDKMPSLSEMFSGISFIIVIPTANNIIRKKIPFIGGLISSIFNIFIEKLTDKVADILNIITNSKKIEKVERTQNQMAKTGVMKINNYNQNALEILAELRIILQMKSSPLLLKL